MGSHSRSTYFKRPEIEREASEIVIERFHDHGAISIKQNVLREMVYNYAKTDFF